MLAVSRSRNKEPNRPGCIETNMISQFEQQTVARDLVLHIIQGGAKVGGQ